MPVLAYWPSRSIDDDEVWNGYHTRHAVYVRQLVSQILTQDPQQQPTLHDILDHGFFTQGTLPSYIPMTHIPPYQTFGISHGNKVKRISTVTRSSTKTKLNQCPTRGTVVLQYTMNRLQRLGYIIYMPVVQYLEEAVCIRPLSPTLLPLSPQLQPVGNG